MYAQVQKPVQAVNQLPNGWVGGTGVHIWATTKLTDVTHSPSGTVVHVGLRSPGGSTRYDRASTRRRHYQPDGEQAMCGCQAQKR